MKKLICMTVLLFSTMAFATESELTCNYMRTYLLPNGDKATETITFYPVAESSWADYRIDISGVATYLPGEVDIPKYVEQQLAFHSKTRDGFFAGLVRDASWQITIFTGDIRGGKTTNIQTMITNLPPGLGFSSNGFSCQRVAQ